MADEKIIIASIKENGDWINVTTNEDKQIGINKTKNPVITGKLSSAKPGDEVVLSLWEKGDKIYGFDPKGAGGAKGGGKSLDKSFEGALAAAQAAATAISLKKDSTLEDFNHWFEAIHKKIMEKVTK